MNLCWVDTELYTRVFVQIETTTRLNKRPRRYSGHVVGADARAAQSLSCSGVVGRFSSFLLRTWTSVAPCASASLNHCSSTDSKFTCGGWRLPAADCPWTAADRCLPVTCESSSCRQTTRLWSKALPCESPNQKLPVSPSLCPSLHLFLSSYLFFSERLPLSASLISWIFLRWWVNSLRRLKPASYLHLQSLPHFSFAGISISQVAFWDFPP